MFLPLSCDALLYHLPYATVGLIVANVAVFAGMASGTIDPLDGWVLMYGQGMHPTQWLLSLFTHADFSHLLANMFFLWVFGLVTEGKLGWWRFLACYFVIGLGQSAIEQAIMLGSTPGPGSVGASSAIYGLMAMACVWAPMNSVKMFGFFLYFPISFDVRVAALAAFYVGIEFALAVLVSSVHLATGHGFLGSSLLHLMGVVLGGILGTILLKRKQVDCEHWDLFSVLRDEAGQPSKQEIAPPSQQQIQAYQGQRADEAKKKILAYLQIDQAPQALLVWRKVQDLKLPLELNRQEQFKLIAGLDKHKQWADSAPLMTKYLEEFPEGSEAVRLRLAQICLVELQRPARTLELLGTLDTTKLTENQNLLRKKLSAVAKKQIEEGEVELDDVI